jgi:hypothetical protein
MVKFGKGSRMAWYPTAVGIPFFQDEWPQGFDTPEEAQAAGLKMKEQFAQDLLAPAPHLI